MRLHYKGNKNLVQNARQLQKNMTKEERRLWYCFLREYPIRFYRQKILGKYIVDFYCAEAKLVIELDGSQHYDPINQELDEKRTDFLREYGLYVIRIPNNAVNNEFDSVCAYIDHEIKKRLER